jgi:hypothetical protein
MAWSSLFWVGSSIFCRSWPSKEEDNFCSPVCHNGSIKLPSYCIMDCEGIQYEWRVFRVVGLNWESCVKDQSDIWAHLISGNIVYDSDSVSCIARSSALIFNEQPVDIIRNLLIFLALWSERWTLKFEVTTLVHKFWVLQGLLMFIK